MKLFDEIALKNLWGDPDSRSGTGSNLYQTRIIREKIPLLLHQYGVKKILDAPCGDVFWMKEILPQLGEYGIDYVGIDVVSDLINENRKYESSRVKFNVGDITQGPLPRVDLIFTRDCFLHLSFNKILLTLETFQKAGAQYLLVSTYYSPKRRNQDVYEFLIGGRALNMQHFPFYFSQPLELIVEGCTEGNGAYSDKSLGLWRLADINTKKIKYLVRIFFFLLLLQKIWLKLTPWVLKYKYKLKSIRKKYI